MRAHTHTSMYVHTIMKTHALMYKSEVDINGAESYSMSTYVC